MRIGSSLGSYAVVDLLGEGSATTVYEAEHEILRRRAAIKLLRPELASRPDVVSRFFTAARGISRLGDQHIVTIFDCGRTQAGEPYIIMEYLEGAPLSLQLLSRERYAPGHAVHICLQVLDGLQAAHEEGVVHGDLRPENIFLNRRRKEADFVKIADFGLARLATGGGTEDRGAAPFAIDRAARSAAVIDPREDIHNAGCILYQMLTGQRPAADEAGLLPSARALNPAVPQALDQVLQGCLARQPEQRFQSAAALAEALKAALAAPAPPAVVPVPVPAPVSMQAPEPPADEAQAAPAAAPSAAPPVEPAPVEEARPPGPAAPVKHEAPEPARRETPPAQAIPAVSAEHSLSLSGKTFFARQPEPAEAQSHPGFDPAVDDSSAVGAPHSRRFSWLALLMAICVGSIIGGFALTGQKRLSTQLLVPPDRPTLSPGPAETPPVLPPTVHTAAPLPVRPALRPALPPTVHTAAPAPAHPALRPTPPPPAPRPKEPEAQKPPQRPALAQQEEPPASFAGRMAQADHHIKLRQFLEAQRILLSLEPDHRDDPEIYVRLGACDMGTEHYQSAVEHYQQALKYQPTYARAMFGLGYAFEQRGELSLAVHWYNKYLDATPAGEYANLAEEHMERLQARLARSAQAR